jgi:hypothetical protein
MFLFFLLHLCLEVWQGAKSVAKKDLILIRVWIVARVKNGWGETLPVQ